MIYFSHRLQLFTPTAALHTTQEGTDSFPSVPISSGIPGCGDSDILFSFLKKGVNFPDTGRGILVNDRLLLTTKWAPPPPKKKKNRPKGGCLNPPNTPGLVPVPTHVIQNPSKLPHFSSLSCWAVQSCCTRSFGLWLCSHGLESRSERCFRTWFGPFLIWKPDFSPCECKAVSNQAFETCFETRKKGRFGTA